MLNCVRVINEENARLVSQGRKEGIKEERKKAILEKRNMIINMLKSKLTDEHIKKIVEIGDKELQAIKNELKVKI